MDSFQMEAKQTNFPISISKSSLKTGYLWLRQDVECLTMVHPKHQEDYFGLVMNNTRQGNCIIFHIYLCGKSALFKDSTSLRSFIAETYGSLHVRYKPMTPSERLLFEKEREQKKEECDWYIYILETLKQKV